MVIVALWLARQHSWRDLTYAYLPRHICEQKCNVAQENDLSLNFTNILQFSQFTDSTYKFLIWREALSFKSPTFFIFCWFKHPSEHIYESTLFNIHVYFIFNSYELESMKYYLAKKVCGLYYLTTYHTIVMNISHTQIHNIFF